MRPRDITRHLAPALALALVLTASGGTTMGQTAPPIRTYVWDLSAFVDPCAQSCYLDALLVGPLGGTAVEARLFVEFQPIDRYDPALIWFDLYAPIVRPDGGIGVHWRVYGADFGWTGKGQLTGASRSDSLDGPIGMVNGFPLTLWPLHVGNIAERWTGRLTKLRYEVDFENLVADESCTGDLNGDGVVDNLDLAVLNSLRGACASADCPADLNGDGFVDDRDVQILLVMKGGVCPVPR